MSLENIQRSYDALIIGARCAGAATALSLARRGLRVLAVDRGAPGADALSTHALMRGGVLQLQRFGILERLKDAGTPCIRETSFHYGDEVVKVPIKARDGVDGLYAPRRTLLDAQLVDGAREAGAEIRHHVRLERLLRSSEGRVSGLVLEDRDGRRVEIDTGIVVGADGLRSTVAELVGARTYQAGQFASTLVYAYWAGLRLDGYQWFYRPGVSAGAIPTNDRLQCLFVAAPPARFARSRGGPAADYATVLAEAAPELSRALSTATRVGGHRVFAGARGFFRQSWGAGWALVGDAGYFRDPITAHGITDALRDAEVLARAIHRGRPSDLAEYQATRDQLSVGVLKASDAVASFAWDVEALKQHHLAISENMAREVTFLATLDPATPQAA